VRTEERWDDDEPVEPPWHAPGVDGAWLRTANPNTADGELQNIAAFSSGLARLSGPRRTAAKAVVWLVLIGICVTIAFGVVGIVRTW
jgi:hypothetical protein